MSPTPGTQISHDSLKAMVLAYGINHAYRVITLEEIAHTMPHIRRDEVRKMLEQLAEEGLVTRFSGRYCFNKTIPLELRSQVDALITPSGTVRQTS